MADLEVLAESQPENEERIGISRVQSCPLWSVLIELHHSFEFILRFEQRLLLVRQLRGSLAEERVHLRFERPRRFWVRFHHFLILLRARCTPARDEK